jgi:hypothetical protein
VPLASAIDSSIMSPTSSSIREISAHRVAQERSVSYFTGVPRLSRANEEIKDPYVLEFLGLKDDYSETQLENALIEKLQAAARHNPPLRPLGQNARCARGGQGIESATPLRPSLSCTSRISSGQHHSC